MRRLALPKRKTKSFVLVPDREKFTFKRPINKLRGQELWLTVIDVEGREFRKYFKFEDKSLK